MWILVFVSLFPATKRVLNNSASWRKEVMLPLGRPLNHFCAMPLRVVGKYRQHMASCTSWMYICDLLTSKWSSGSVIPPNGWTEGILTLLGRGASKISRLKGAAKVGNNRLLEELPTPSTGGRGGPTSINVGVLLYFNIAPCPRPTFGLSRSERGWVRGGIRVSIWALLIDCSGEWAILLECSL